MTKYAIVTGSSITSIGFLAAKKLSAHYEKIILACRSDASGAAAMEQLPTGEYCRLDLADFDSIRSFADTVLNKVDGGAIGQQGLDCLVCNAGLAWGGPYQTTSNELEEIVGVNHAGHFLLTNLLLDALKKAQNARVVVVASSLHDLGAGKELLPDFPQGIFTDPPVGDAPFDGMRAYRVSKLCNIWFAYELYRRHGIISNAVSPGFIPTTGLNRNSGAFAQFMLHYVLDPLRHLGIGPTSSPDHGAETIAQAVLNDIASKGGEYFRLEKGVFKAIQSSAESYDEDKARQLWELTAEKCQLK